VLIGEVLKWSEGKMRRDEYTHAGMPRSTLQSSVASHAQIESYQRTLAAADKLDAQEVLGLRSDEGHTNEQGAGYEIVTYAMFVVTVCGRFIGYLMGLL